MLLVRPNGIERFYTRLLNFSFLPAPKNASAQISNVFSHSKQFVPIAFCTEGLVQVIPVVLSRIICYRRTRTIQHKPTSELMVLNIVNHGLASTGSRPIGKWYPNCVPQENLRVWIFQNWERLCWTYCIRLCQWWRPCFIYVSFISFVCCISCKICRGQKVVRNHWPRILQFVRCNQSLQCMYCKLLQWLCLLGVIDFIVNASFPCCNICREPVLFL